VAAPACGLSLVGDLTDKPDGGAPTLAPDGATPPSEADALANDSTPPTDAPPPAPCTIPDAGIPGTSCNGACVDPATDPKNCGGCGTVCNAISVCEVSKCLDVGSSASPLRIELPCTDNDSPYCATGAGTKSQSKTIGGTTGKTYRVAIRVRGVVEQKDFTGTGPGNATGTNAGFFVMGGTPDGSNWNNYTLTVSDPPATYRLNSGQSNHNYCDRLDYTATILAKAGAAIAVSGTNQDPRSAVNRNQSGDPIVVANIPPAPQAFDGQFVQIDIESVTAN